jgi:flagellar basal body-associated protein FliL
MEAVVVAIVAAGVFWWLIKSQENRTKEWNRQAEEAEKDEP